MSLEDNVGRFDRMAFERAQARMKSAPLELTEHDFDQLAIVSGSLERDAREAVRVAQLALVPPASAPAVKTKRAAMKMDAFADALFGALKPVFESYKTKLATLDQRHQALEARVLELEAQQVMADVDR